MLEPVCEADSDNGGAALLGLAVTMSIDGLREFDRLDASGTVRVVAALTGVVGGSAAGSIGSRLQSGCDGSWSIRFRGWSVKLLFRKDTARAATATVA